tara:strand:+ start:472 stop:621 length:150 start_codon:yes stop_codon:yes gene_type:complete
MLERPLCSGEAVRVLKKKGRSGIKEGPCPELVRRRFHPLMKLEVFSDYV